MQVSRKSYKKSALTVVLFSALLLAACSGNYSSPAPAGMTGGNAGTGSSGTVAASSVNEYFSKSAQPNLNFCRTCHIPGGVADTDGSSVATQGKLFMLSSDPSQDYVNLQESWANLGKGVDANKLLTKPSDLAQSHTGGQPWPVGSQAYQAMKVVLSCWDHPAGCATLLTGDVTAPVAQLPLLGSSHARSYMDTFCEGKSDGAVLPQDPRELIRPGISDGKAVAFNAYWQDCTGPGNNPQHRPLTCGDYRTRAAQGEALMRTDLTLTLQGQGVIPSQLYNQMWTRWGGLTARPADFDAEVNQRYGLPPAPFNNPYPLPGEDAKKTNGGSGQLPLGLVQVKDANGQYTGTISVTCDICHSSDILGLADNGGNAFVSGMGANTADMQLLMSDLLMPLLPFGLNDSRGVTNAEGLSGLLIGMLDIDSLGFAPESSLLSQLPGNTSGGGDTKMPAWWNASHRPRKFWDGGFSYDAARLDTAILNAFRPLGSPFGTDKAYNHKGRELVETESLAAQAYMESLQSPVYPGAIDTALAEQGAVLFHTKDLWANGANANIPKPPTNGSCAGCHGAYSPRYVNDPTYLADPRLEGMAGYISPLDQIRTDPERVKGFTPPLLEIMSTSWFSYPEGSPGYVSPDVKDPVTERLDDTYIYLQPGKRIKGACTWEGAMPGDAVGYLAPPLYGIWATAPYLHNGSVPDVWDLLKPSDRPSVWRRQLTSGPGPVPGFDTRWAAYDQAKMGWKYNLMSCQDGGIPYLSCEPENVPSSFTDVFNFISTLPGTFNTLGYQVTPPLTPELVAAREVFNTHQFGKSNAGHDFTAVLTDQERKALIEYLKTL